MSDIAMLKNNVIFGRVNANKRHWYEAAQALARNSDDIKVVIQFAEV